MPKLINYLDRVNPGRQYDEFELEELQQAYDQACARLAIPVGDPRREWVAILVFQAAELSMKEIPSRVVAQFRLLS